jgi:hypothetical protein
MIIYELWLLQMQLKYLGIVYCTFICSHNGNIVVEFKGAP